MSTCLRLLISASFAVTLWAAPNASAQNLVGRTSSGLFGIKAGIISRMDLKGERYLHSEIGSCAQVFADFPKGRNFYLTAAFDFYYIDINNSSQIMIEAGLGLKRAYSLPHLGMVLKPGASVGFGYLAEMGDLPASNFLTFKLLFETLVKISAKKAWIGELALFHAPTGTNGRSDLSFGPGVMLRLGLAFR